MRIYVQNKVRIAGPLSAAAEKYKRMERTLDTVVTGEGQPTKFSGWRMVFFAFLVGNIVLGTTYGGYGISVLAIAEKFSVSRAMAALPISFILLVGTASAPLITTLFKHVPIRWVIIAGLTTTSAGYLLLSVTADWRTMLAIYLFMIGPGVAASGFLPVNILVSNWFVRSQGRALGITNMTLFVMLVPIVAVFVLQAYNLSAVYLFQAGLNAAAIPIAVMLVDCPSHAGQQPLGMDDQAYMTAEKSDEPTLTQKGVVQIPIFWVLAIALGFLMSSGTIKLSHMVPLLAENGYAVDTASLLLGLSGGAGIAGSLIFGMLADRFGGSVALIINAVLQACMWGLLLLPLSVPVLALDAIIMGMCGGGLLAAQGVLFTRLFGQRNFGVVMGMWSASTAPIMVGASPIVGLLRDVYGNYHVPILFLIALIACSILAFTYIGARVRRDPELSLAG